MPRTMLRQLRSVDFIDSFGTPTDLPNFLDVLYRSSFSPPPSQSDSHRLVFDFSTPDRGVLILSRTEFLPMQDSRHFWILLNKIHMFHSSSKWILTIESIHLFHLAQSKIIAINYINSASTGYSSFYATGQELKDLAALASLPHSSVLHHPTSPVSWLHFLPLLASTTCLHQGNPTPSTRRSVLTSHSAPTSIVVSSPSPSPATILLSSIGGSSPARFSSRLNRTVAPLAMMCSIGHPSHRVPIGTRSVPMPKSSRTSSISRSALAPILSPCQLLHNNLSQILLSSLLLR